MTITHKIPTIDLSPYFNSYSTAEARSKVIDEVKSACSYYGFLQVKGHGVPVQMQRNVLECCKILFDLPMAEKDKLSLKNNSARRGYERIGDQILNEKALPDFKEICFYIGREIPPEEASFLRGPNLWPDFPDEQFHTPVSDYYSHMLRLSNALLEILVIGLGHDPSVLSTFTKEPVMNLKLLHYPPHTSTDTRQFGAAAHTDFGAMTLLLQQPGKHALQVYHAPTEEWLAVPAVEDVFVVNMGDLIQKWTDGAYSSTLHRVINKADGDRYSVPCFYSGDMDATTPFRPGGMSGETVGEHMKRRFDLSYGMTGK